MMKRTRAVARTTKAWRWRKVGCKAWGISMASGAGDEWVVPGGGGDATAAVFGGLILTVAILES